MSLNKEERIVTQDTEVSTQRGLIWDPGSQAMFRVNADGTRNLVPGGRGFCSAVLTAAQVLALFTTPVQLLPAPGAGLMYIADPLLLNYQFKGTPYTAGGGTFLAGNGGQGQMSAPITGLIDQGSSQVVQTGVMVSNINTLAQVANQPFTVFVTTANPTLGNGLLGISFTYRIAAIS